jgi:hypothetical protein
MSFGCLTGSILEEHRMFRHILAVTALLASAPVALAKEVITMLIAETDPAGEMYCAVTLLPDGRMTTVRQVMRNSFPAPELALEPTEAWQTAFKAALEALRAGEFPQGEALLPSDPQDKRLVPPYVLLAYARHEGEEITEGYRAVLPGIKVPPVMLALFGPLYGGGCVTPVED